MIVAVQVTCVAVGLWVQYRYVNSDLARKQEKQAWSILEHSARQNLSSVNSNEPPATQAAKHIGERHNGDLAGDIELAEKVSILRTDNQWRVLALHTARTTVDAPIWSIGESLTWDDKTLTGRSNPAGGTPFRGILKATDAEYMAVAIPNSDHSGFVVACVDRQPIGALVSGVADSMAPISAITLVWTCALMAIATHTILSSNYNKTEAGQRRSAAETLKQAQTFIRTRDAVIFGLAKLADSRDPETGDHLDRISVYCRALASALQHHPAYATQITPGFVRLIGISSALHDIGKVGIEDRILLKPGKLTESETERMKQHALIGSRCLQEIEQRLGSSNFLQMAREIAAAHHEHWDGGGYPYGLSGNDIPLAARIVAIADVYDALASKRVYKDAMTHETCVNEIRRRANTQFDPELVDVWLTIESQFRSIANQYVVNAGTRPPTGSKTLVLEGAMSRDEVESADEIETLAPR